MKNQYTIKVNGVTLATFTNRDIWDMAQDTMTWARKDCGISWSHSIDCENWIIDYKSPCYRDEYIITYYQQREAIRNSVKAA